MKQTSEQLDPGIEYISAGGLLVMLFRKFLHFRRTS